MTRIRRRDVLALLGSGALAWPAWSPAQAPALPVIGFLHSRSRGSSSRLLTAFHQGLAAEGFAEGRDVAIEYRWAEGRPERLPQHAADLVRRQVKLIAATGGLPSAIAARQATATIPVLFIAGSDPSHPSIGLVASLNRPGGNATGVSAYTTDLTAKRLELLREVAPTARTIAMLVTPGAYAIEFERKLAAEVERKDAGDAAQRARVQLLVLEASSDAELEAQFETAARRGAGALLVSADPFFTERRARIVALAARHRLPAVYPLPPYTEAGGLISYGPSIIDAYRRVGIYAGRILKGARPQDLPVEMPTAFELIVNLKTAKALGIAIPEPVLSTANEIIE